MVVGGSPGRLAGILVTFVTRSWGHVGVVSEVGGTRGRDGELSWGSGQKLGDPVEEFAVRDMTGYNCFLPIVRMGIELFHCTRKG